MTRFAIEKLTKLHALEDFDCGDDALNRFLVRHALANQSANAAQTYLGLADGAVVGFYSLVVGSVEPEEPPARVAKGLGRYPVPIMLLARLGVSFAWQGRGVGAGLLRDAVLRTLQAADIAGIRAIAVHAKNETAREFYRRYGFQPSPTDPLHLFALLKDLRG